MATFFWYTRGTERSFMPEEEPFIPQEGLIDFEIGDLPDEDDAKTKDAASDDSRDSDSVNHEQPPHDSKSI